MPRVRQTFLKQLPDRVQEVVDGVAALRELGEADHRPMAEQVLSATHNLSGTAGTVGADEMGKIATRMAAESRGWLQTEEAPSQESIDVAVRDAEALERTAQQFHRWMEWTPAP